MQEIEFRGKRLDNGECVTGFYVSLWHNDDKSHYHAYIIPVDMCLEILPDPETNKVMVEVDPETVGQYARLEDKNGAFVYDGDVIRVSTAEKSHQIQEIVFVDGAFCGYSTRKDLRYTYLDVLIRAHGIEVIGNVFDNPEYKMQRI